MAVMHVTKSISTEVGAICAHALILRSLQRQLRFVNEYNEYWQYLRLLTQPNDNKCLSRWAQHMNRPIKHKSFLRTMENYVCVCVAAERAHRKKHAFMFRILTLFDLCLCEIYAHVSQTKLWLADTTEVHHISSSLADEHGTHAKRKPENS